MKRFIPLVVIALAAGGPLVRAQNFYVSPDVPSDPDGSTLLPWDIVNCAAGTYTTVLTVPGDPAINAVLKMDAADSWLFSVEAPNDLAGNIVAPIPGDDAEPRDVIRDDGSGSFVKFLCGDVLADPLPPDANIDALYLDGGDVGDLILSFEVPIELPSGSGTFHDPADLVRFERSNPLDCADWTFVVSELDASAAGVPISTNVIGAARVGSQLILSLDVATDLTAACSASTTCTPGQVVSLSGGTFGLFRDLQTIGTPGWTISSLVDGLSCEANPGVVFDPTALPVGLLLDKAEAPPDIVLSWPGGSCSSGALDYGIYEGSIDSVVLGVYDHIAVDCSDNLSDLTEQITPSAASSYYLVVPHNLEVEGSYGTDSNGSPRPQPALVDNRCQEDRVITSCP